ncbi:MAG: PaaX family transcriptional regulator C-terminal domain-containing protein [Zavarzinia sp.]|nr:PaaX family transcriptional regulator C-terminal domain-containing protein [Zavarzinia sp.]
MSATPKPKNLILQLLLVERDGDLSARDAVRACGLFGIAETTVRVTLVRLAAAGLIEGAARGTYRLGPAATGLAADVARWREAGDRLRPWQGGWIAVHCGALGRSDRPALRVRQRALDLLGFRELDKGLFLRPDNVAGGVEGVRDRLHALGLEAEALVFAASGFDRARETAARALWDGAALNAGYEERHALGRWLDHADELAPEVAARDAFLIGGRAIRRIVFDPLLPDPLIDAGAREAYFAAVRYFDSAGHRIWQRLFAAQQHIREERNVHQLPAE